MGIPRLLLIVPLLSPIFAAADEPDAAAVREGVHRAVRFFRHDVAGDRGGYLWRYSADLSLREGEGVASKTTAWLQPPGTPSVGEAYLNAYLLTKDPVLKEAVVETAMALVRGQLQSGGWSNDIQFAPEDRKKIAYRVDDKPGKFNRTTFDDDKSQSALRFLMRTDQTLEFKTAAIHEACQYALDAFIKAQYPNGAWPQQYDEFPIPADFPVTKAGYPANWPREYPSKKYTEFYTLNDGNIAKLIETMLLAAEVYQEPRYKASAIKGGEFFLLAQMPDPQPGWAQQYSREMHPVWARKFEPPSITGGESQGVMETLLLLARETGDDKFLKPIPQALAYYKKSVLPNGRLARFYELKTNRPLYFTKDYQLTYSSDDMPTHYAFIVGNSLDRIQREYDRLASTDRSQWKSVQSERKSRMTSGLKDRARKILADMDDRGAWVERGELKYHKDASQVREIIDPKTFRKNLETLAEFLAASSSGN
jgi:PelA/Pel-15E family pectate lyase